MQESTPKPQINVSKIQAGGGLAGALFAATSVAILLTGIPRLRYFLPAAAGLGCVVALVMRCLRHEAPGRPWINQPAQAPKR